MPSGVYERTDWHRQVLSRAQKGRMFSKEHRRNKGLAQLGAKNHQWKGGKVNMTCKHCGRKFKTPPSELRRNGGQYCSYACAYASEERKSKLKQHAVRQWQDEEYRLNHTGENNPMWKDGRTSEIHKHYNTRTHRRRRKKLLERDGCVCLFCGKKDANTAHHLIPAFFYPEFRLELDNGITYCEECHSIIHVLGNQFNSNPTI